MINATLNVFDAGFSALDRIERIDYVKAGEVIINFSLTATAIIHAVLSYAITAFLCWWDDNEERVVVNTVRFTVATADFAGACYFAGRKLRPVINHWVARLADTAFFKLAA